MGLDNITVEVKKKIKSAIKAKLTELGAYVDDDLPDYIMVLVSNKKTKEQMDEDLSLFLNFNTDKFTSWLHNVLEKLNAASILQTETKTVVIKKKEEKKEKKIEQKSDNDEKEEGEIEIENNEIEEVKEEEEVPKPDEKKKHKKKKDKSEKKEKKEKKKKKDKEHSKEKKEKKEKKKKLKKDGKQQEEAEVLEIKVEEKTNTIIVDVEDEGDVIVQEKEDVIQEIKETEIEETQEESPREEENEIEEKRVEDEEESENDVVNLRTDDDDLALCLEDEIPVVKKVKLSSVIESPKEAPSSSVTTVANFKIQVDNTPPERETSPENEPVTTSSTLSDRLGPPKRIINLREESSFPSSSSSGIGKRLEARVRPLVSSAAVVPIKAKAPPSPPLSSVVGRVTNVSQPAPRMMSTIAAVRKRPHEQSDESDEAEKPVSKRVASIASKVEVKPRPRRAGSSQANTALILRAVADANKSIKSGSKRPAEDDNEMEQPSNKKELFTRGYQERHGHRSSNSTDAKLPTTSKPGVRKLAITVPNALRDEEAVVKKKRRIARDEEMEAEFETSEYIEKMDTESSLSADGITKRETLNQRNSPVSMETTPSNTRFIVTLAGMGEKGETNGAPQAVVAPQQQTALDLRSKISGRPVHTPSIDEEEFIDEVEEWEEEVEEMDGVGGGQAVATTPFSAKWTASSADNTAKIDFSDLLTMKSTERCRFWPSCKEGASCQFVHPTKPCNTFPNCRFGDKCLYTHPSCKFDAICTKPNCPFNHSTPRTFAVAAPVLPKVKVTASKAKVKCRFYPKCIDMNCPFMHPKQICRYGKSCQTPSCLYVHPDVTTGSQLKWTAPKASATSGVVTSTTNQAITAE